MRTRRFARCLFAALLLSAGLHTTWADELDLAAPLPVDPNVKMIELPNGLTCWIRAHSTPPNRMGVWLHVGSGSMNEEDEERGLAHFLEHMAFRGSENFPPGTLVKYFESIGLTFGHHQNAFTGFDQTTFVLTLPNTEEETLRKGLLCMADFAHRLSLPGEELEKERGVVLEEIRARKGARQRIVEKLLPVLLPGSRAAERLPIGKEEVVESVERRQFVDYYRTWYRSDNSTLLIVGDIDPEALAAMVTEGFADWEAVSDPAENADPGIKLYRRTRASTITDPELTTADASVVSVKSLEALKTVGDFRRELVDDIGMWIVNRRLGEMVQKGTAPFQRARLTKYPLWNVCTYVEAEATGQPDRSVAMLESVLTELKRAREHGFLAQELGDARKAILASAEQDAKTEPTRDARAFLGYMNDCVSRERKPMSESQRLGLLKALMDGVTLEEAWAAFRRNFDAETRLLLVTMPEKEDLAVPPDEELLAVAEEVEASEVEPLLAKERPDDLLEAEPTPGHVVEQEEDPDLKVLSVTLSNGVRAHLRSMDYKKDHVIVAITLAGGAIRETAMNRGITGVATLAFNRPAGGRLSSTDIRDMMTGKNVALSGRAGRDLLVISIAGTPEDIEEGFRLAHLLLTQPRIEPPALKIWKERRSQEIEERKTSVVAHRNEEVMALLSKNDPRLEFLVQEQVDRLTLEDGQQWLEGIIRSAPMEVAVVGDIERDRALALTLKYLGSLSRRPLADVTLDGLREIERTPGPLVSAVEVETITPKAVLLVGWRGAPWTAVKERRVLQIAAQILTTRLREEIREELGLAYSPYCIARAGKAYPAVGLFSAYLTADPDNVTDMAEATRRVIEQFAKDGPTDDEMQATRKQFRNLIETDQKEPGYWASVLSDLDYHGTRLADVKQAMEMYTSYTREDVMEVVSKYLTEERRIQVIALPQKEPEEPEAHLRTPTAEPAAVR